VFQRCLDAHAVPANQRQELFNLYQDVLRQVLEADTHAE